MPRETLDWLDRQARYFLGPHGYQAVAGINELFNPVPGLMDAVTAPGAMVRGDVDPVTGVTQMAGGLLDAVPGPGGEIATAASKMVPAGLLGHMVFHGTPHHWLPEPGFPHGRPRLSEIGSGEGVQAYGHGFYAAESPDVAHGYRRVLSRPDMITFKGPGGEAVNKFTDQSQRLRIAHDGPKELDFMIGDRAGELAFRRQQLADPGAQIDRQYFQDKVDQLAQEIDALETLKRNNNYADFEMHGGKVYQVDVPDADIARMMDWEALLPDQPAVVRDILDRFNPMARHASRPEWEMHQMLRSPRGAEMLRQSDVPGLSYLDGNTRQLGAGRPYSFEDWLGEVHGRDVIDIIGTPQETMFDDWYAQYVNAYDAGPTRNFVIWDQDVLDRSTVKPMR